jgi:hypothetical protein
VALIGHLIDPHYVATENDDWEDPQGYVPLVLDEDVVDDPQHAEAVVQQPQHVAV